MRQTGVCQSTRARLAVFFAVAISTVSGVFAADRPALVQAPASIPLAVTIDAENLVELYQSVPELRIIDSRHREDHIQGYIETSLNLPLVDTDCETLNKLANDEEQALVFYCNGHAADASIAAIQIASSCGYKRLFWLRGGFVEWEDKDYPYVIE